MLSHEALTSSLFVREKARIAGEKALLGCEKARTVCEKAVFVRERARLFCKKAVSFGEKARTSGETICIYLLINDLLISNAIHGVDVEWHWTFMTTMVPIHPGFRKTGKWFSDLDLLKGMR